MGWVDTHCHLQLTSAEPELLVARAQEAGVKWLVVPGVDAASSQQAYDLARRLRDVIDIKWTAGLHPHQADHWHAEREQIVELALKAAAVGECGLDFYRNLCPPETQISVLREHIGLAKALDLPVVMHCRDAFAALHELLVETGAGPRTVLHCWTAGPRWTKRFAETGAYFSFAGPLAFETGDTVRQGARHVPRERTMVETDTPFLAPPPHRGEDNEPARVALVGAALADLWQMEIEAVEGLTSAAALEVFWRG